MSALPILALFAVAVLGASAAEFSTQDLFLARNGEYVTCRIPTVLVTPAGSVLVTAEARRGKGGDWDGNDLVIRRSADAGRTWDAQRVLASNGTWGAGPLHNVVPFADAAGGAVHLLFCFDYARVFQITSRDDGRSFSTPVEITAALAPLRASYPWKVVGSGANHGLVLRSGRWVVPVWLSDGSGKEFGSGKLGHRPSVVASMVSDDRGATWRAGGIVSRGTAEIVNPSETAAVELADGRVLFNMRSESKQQRRLVATSPDGAGGWSAPVFHEQLKEPVCAASLIRWSWPKDGAPGVILFTNPDNLESKLTKSPVSRDRKRLTMKLSRDDGATWPVSRVIEEGPSGYSDLAVLPDGTILCVYECGLILGMTDTKSLRLARFDLAWVEGGR